MRNVFDARSGATAQTAQTRHRNYDDEIQCYDHQPPEDAPDWAYTDQPDDIYDTDFDRILGEDAEDFDERSSSKSNPTEAKN